LFIYYVAKQMLNLPKAAIARVAGVDALGSS